MGTALFFQHRPWRLNTALLLSLLAHSLLLSITLGGQSFGLPSLNFPWKERRLGANELRILLAPAQPATLAATPAPAILDTPPTEFAKALPALIEKPAAASDAPPSMFLPSPAVEQREAPAVLISPPPPTAAPSEPAMAARTRPDVNLPIAPNAPPVRAPATAATRYTPVPAGESSVPHDAAQKQIEQDKQERALEQAKLERERLSAERLRQVELMADAQREATRQEQLRQDAARAEQTAKIAAARIELERQEVARQEGLRREALQKERASQDEKAQQEATRQELVRAEETRLEAGRREAARETAAKQEAARQDTAKQDAARQAAARQEAARQEAVRQDVARQTAAKQEAARQDSAKQDAARQDQAKQDQAQRERAEQEAKRDERLRAIGKQLDAEAAQRDAASNRPSRSLLPGISSLRRGWLYGRANPNAELVQYAEAMSRKIEMNITIDTIRQTVKQAHVAPVVTVAIRADGSVEKVTFEVSSGVPAIDESIRNIVASQAPYGAFPPALTRLYDVIEIRRTWIFDTAIRLQ